jgi:hypothetical protein
MSHLAHVGGLYEAVVCIIAPDALQRDLQNKPNILTNKIYQNCEKKTPKTTFKRRHVYRSTEAAQSATVQRDILKKEFKFQNNLL